jgi:CRISPR-associated protein Csb2
MLLLASVHFLTGVFYGSRTPADRRPAYPPQIDTFESALVAALHAHGNDASARAAIAWLEAQAPPTMYASGIDVRSAVTTFVPVNDVRTTRAQSTLGLLREHRPRQERTFPSGTPHEPSMYYAWETEPEPAVLSALDALARNVPSLGHSRTLVRCRFAIVSDDSMLPQACRRQPSTRQVYPGRLADLERWYAAGQRPRPGPACVITSPVAAAKREFANDMLVLEHVDGRVPALTNFAAFARVVRDALMDRWPKDRPVPAWLSGHEPDGTPLRGSHLSVVPLANVGWERSDGSLLGIGLLRPPEVSETALVEAVRSALENDEDGEPVVKICYAPGVMWSLRPMDALEKRSLDPARYTGKSRVWQTVTPIALDRHPKSNDPDQRREQIFDAITRSCEYAGLPQPLMIEISPFASLRGAPAAIDARGALPWQRWQLPHGLTHRMRVHARLTFPAPIEGPVVLGAGRFAGLGLCVPVVASRSTESEGAA